jgi:hypothetical protein
MDRVIPAAATEIQILSSETGKKTCKEVWWTLSLSTSRERDVSRLDAEGHMYQILVATCFRRWTRTFATRRTDYRYRLR